MIKQFGLALHTIKIVKLPFVENNTMYISNEFVH